MSTIRSLFLVAASVLNLAAPAQEVLDISTEVLKKNKIHKCREHVSGDPSNTVIDTANTRYVIFDTEGRKIEQNVPSGMGEMKVFYMYDKLGRESMFVWQQENMIPNITRVYIHQYDEKGKKTGYCDYSPDRDPSCNTVTDYFYKYDTIFNRRNAKQIKVVACYDLAMKDTVYAFTKFYNNKRLDSTKIYDLNTSPVETETVHYIYNSANVKQAEKLLRRDYKRVLRRKDSYYLENGLLDYVETRNTYYERKTNSWITDYSKVTFDYFYRK